ncbi:hypothetical protein [Variovorax boronicumulans]|uniref:hypothetical protein n=1 Tax=Variovorax boronicumulans TaxID=436515 RepID=UPI001C59F049
MRIDVLAAATGIVGAFLMAMMTVPALAFGLFLASNTAWMAHGAKHRQWPLFTMQLIFSISSLLGLWNSWLGPLILG